MEAYLVNGRRFSTAFCLESVGQCYEVKSTSDFVVDLQPVPQSDESLKFCEAIKTAMPMPQTSRDLIGGLRRRTISVSLKFKSDNGMYCVQGAYPPHWTNGGGVGPCTLQIHVMGPYLIELMTKFKQPLMMKVGLQLGKNSEIDVWSREMDLGWTCEEQWKLTHIANFPVFLSPSIYSGKMTILLVGVTSERILRQFVGPLPDAHVMNRKLFEDKIQCDFAIIAENGTSIPCHKSFLAMNSKVFERMLETDCKETRENAYKLRMSEGGVYAFLKFLYYFNLEDPTNKSSIALELLKVAHEYDIQALEKVMKRMFLFADPSNLWLDVDVMLLLFQYSMKVDDFGDLKKKAVLVLKLKEPQLRESKLCNKMFKEDPELAKELFLECLK
ncbi:unnamed protein product [Orchesella dallaii]|uniref:BTB domain-containing protein n=1 Tax=Orchesella dallaii TaxID=48710 RepID=A0ABP1QMU3_9HEXA